MTDVAQGYPIAIPEEETAKARDTYRELWQDTVRERDRYKAALEQSAGQEWWRSAQQIAQTALFQEHGA